MKVSDYIAQYLAEKGVRHIFCISGAGNIHLLDSFGRHPKLEYVCPHHEQAGVMAAIAYRRTGGKPGVMVTTSGAGATNAITGVLDAWADSVPVVVISGQEKSVYARHDNPLRMWGVQGFDIVRAVSGITKYAAMVSTPAAVREHLDRAFYHANHGRPGPVWLDIPVDVQTAPCEPRRLKGFRPPREAAPDLSRRLPGIVAALRKARRPVFILGNGLRWAGAAALVPKLVRAFPYPCLSGWNGKGLLPDEHPLNFGHEGTYGQRHANFIVQNADLVVSIGARMSLPMVGYDFSEFARGARKVFVDIDQAELDKFGRQPGLSTVRSDAGRFVEQLLKAARGKAAPRPEAWLARCRDWKARYPVYDPAIHPSRNGLINSYDFVGRLAARFRPDETVVTDMGTALTGTFQALRLKKGQRIVTTTGLGEMGFGLPGAVGASLATGKGRVVLFNGDGSMMMNLQELQTIVHHRLPIKIFVYVNDGYLTIRNTQAGVFGKRFSATGARSGVSCPDFVKLGKALGLRTFRIRKAKEADRTIAAALRAPGPVICEVAIDPVQFVGPKLSFSVLPDGSLVSPPLEDLYPFIPREQLKREMIVGVHAKSLKI